MQVYGDAWKPILERHNAFQWDLDAWRSAWRSVCWPLKLAQPFLSTFSQVSFQKYPFTSYYLLGLKSKNVHYERSSKLKFMESVNTDQKSVWNSDKTRDSFSKATITSCKNVLFSVNWILNAKFILRMVALNSAIPFSFVTIWLVRLILSP